METKIVFVTIKLKRDYEKLKNSGSGEREIYKWLNSAFERLKKDPFCGIQIPSRLIPQEYRKKYRINNLWKLNMPEGWRLIYSVAADQVLILAIILEWMNHKKYERRFGYTS